MTIQLPYESPDTDETVTGDLPTGPASNVEALKTICRRFVAAVEDQDRSRATGLSRHFLLELHEHLAPGTAATTASDRNSLVKSLQRRLLLDARRLVLNVSILGTEPSILAAARELQDLTDFYSRQRI